MNSSLVHILTPDDYLFFLHIRKTGGTSMRAVVANFFAPDEINPNQMYDPHDFIQAKSELGNYRLIRAHIPYTTTQIFPNQPYIMTVLRNPVKRVLSLYKHLHRTNGHNMDEAVLDFPLVEFVKYFANNPEYRNVPVTSGQTTSIGWHLDFEPHVEETIPDTFWLNPTAENLELAKQRLIDMEFVGITERFNDSVRLLSYTFGFFPRIDYLARNVAPNQIPEEESAEVLGLIGEVNHLDLALYDFGCKLFDERYRQMQADLIAKYKPTAVVTDLNDEDWLDLLELHYAEHYPKRHPNPTDSLTFDFSKGIDGTGWHLAEYQLAHKRWVCWTGPSTNSIIDLPIDAKGDLKLECEILRALSSEVFESLQIEVNNKPIDIMVKHLAGQQRLVTAYIPHTIIGDKPFIRVKFKVSETLIPANLLQDNKDTRQLGLLFNEIRISPC